MPGATRNVKGFLFRDYVRMIRGHKGIGWAELLPREDLFYLRTPIETNDWYPMETFERLGNAILKTVAQGDLEAVRMWGRFSVDQLRSSQPRLVAKADPVETMCRFRVQRATYFDFEAIELPTLTEGYATVVIHYFMGNTAEQAASHQTMGFFERLLELAGALSIEAHFTERSWVGDERTALELHWQVPLGSDA